MPPAARSSSTSVTAGARSPPRWPSRRAAWPTPTAAPSPRSRWSGTRRAVGRHLPLDGAVIYPVSGGSEAIETALKLARAYHIARGEPDRWIVFGRWGSYHGNTLGALDLSGRKPLRRPYEGWLGRFRHLSAAYPYRAGDPGANALATGDELAQELEAAILAAGPGTVAAFVAEPIVGATLAAAVPPDDYWPKIAEVCRRHGVLLIADEVMTGFGRTGRWFGLDHWASSRTCSSPRRARPPATGRSGSSRPRTRSTTRSPTARASSMGSRIRTVRWRPPSPTRSCGSSRTRISSRPARPRASGSCRSSSTALGAHPNVGEIRGRGLLVGLELVADRESRAPYPAAPA